MQTPNLSGAVRAFMHDPDGFRRRMAERAAVLFAEGYTVSPGDAIGLFTVSTPQAIDYSVDVLKQDCTCPYQQKAELPEVACKHLQGLEKLVSEQVNWWNWRAGVAEETAGPNNGSAERAGQYRHIARTLTDHWQAAYDAHLCEGYDENEEDAEGYDSTNGGGILW